MDAQILQIQSLYPRIYMACHTDHSNGPSTEDKLSARDGSILAHLSSESFTSPSFLAEHLGITRATLSEALTKLTTLGYVTSETDLYDERRKKVCLTSQGLAAMSSSSVLAYDKIATLMSRLSAENRQRVVDGLKLLADAALAHPLE
jgi:DNA-binding MarR family transcriptional regulator